MAGWIKLAIMALTQQSDLLLVKMMCLDWLWIGSVLVIQGGFNLTELIFSYIAEG